MNVLQTILIPIALFFSRTRVLVGVSDIGILVVTIFLWRIPMVKGVAWMVCVYRVLLMIVIGFFTLITYLNHTNKMVHHYDSRSGTGCNTQGFRSSCKRSYPYTCKIFAFSMSASGTI